VRKRASVEVDSEFDLSFVFLYTFTFCITYSHCFVVSHTFSLSLSLSVHQRFESSRLLFFNKMRDS